MPLRYRRHLPIIAALVLLELLLPGLFHAYYRLFERPRLITSGAVECGKYHPAADQQPVNDRFALKSTKNCDVVVPDQLVVTYYSKSGKEFIVHFDQDGSISSEEDAYPPWLFIIVPFGIGCLLIFAGYVRKSFRTGFRYFWQPVQQNDEIENLLYAYGFALNLSAFCTIAILASL